MSLTPSIPLSITYPDIQISIYTDIHISSLTFSIILPYHVILINTAVWLVGNPFQWYDAADGTNLLVASLRDLMYLQRVVLSGIKKQRVTFYSILYIDDVQIGIQPFSHSTIQPAIFSG